MYHISKTLMAAAAIAISVAACNDQTTDTTSPDMDLVAYDHFGFMNGTGPAPGCGTGPGSCFNGQGGSQSAMAALVREAYQKVLSADGQAAADAAFATLWQLHQDAFALRTGDRDAFVAALQKAHAEAVRIVGEVLGIDASGIVAGPNPAMRGTQYRRGR